MKICGIWLVTKTVRVDDIYTSIPAYIPAVWSYEVHVDD